MFKRFFTLLICLFIVFTSFFSVPVFAGTGEDNDGIPIGYSPAGLNDQVDAFRSYCKSRNLAIEGSAIDTVTYVTSSIYQHLVSDAGLDINQLQNEIYKNTKDNVGAKWFFNTTGIAAYNRLFAELLQNNNLSVGEKVNNVTAWEGERFVDDDGNSCLVYVFDTADINNSIDKSHIVKYGTYLKYDANDLNQLISNDSFFNAEFHIFGRTYSGNLTTFKGNSNGLGWSKVTNQRFNGSSTTIITPYDRYWTFFSYNSAVNGGVIVYKTTGSSSYRLGTLCDGLFANTVVYDSSYFRVKYGPIINTSPLDPDNNDSSISIQNVYYTTNNTTINNNNYEGDTYITNEGDVINNNPVDPGGNDPGWNVGGGQGSYDNGNGNSYTINFPDFELPDLNIDWSIQGLGNKFPFSIPFDIASLISVLNAEPEAPRFQGTVNFGFTTWDYDINLDQFDSVAQACRIAELLLLVFGLILITRSIIKG